MEKTNNFYSYIRPRVPTGLEKLSDKNLIRKFYSKNFLMDISKKNILQEQINRLVEKYDLNNTWTLKIDLDSKTKEDVVLNIDPITNKHYITIKENAMMLPLLLYVQLEGAMKREKDMEESTRNPHTPTGVQLTNMHIHRIETGSTYNNTSINPMIGVGNLDFGKAIPITFDIKHIKVKEKRERLKAESNDYYIQRLQPIERSVSLAMESAYEKLRNTMRDDERFDEEERAELSYVKELIGDIQQDLSEYVAISKCENPLDEIDKYILAVDQDTLDLVQFESDGIKIDIQLASMHEYDKKEGLISNDPRKTRIYNYTPKDFQYASNVDLIRFFYPENWNKLELEEKKNLLQEQCNREAQNLGLQRGYKIVLTYDMPSMAAYPKGTNEIRVNALNLMKVSPILMYGVIPHELVHARQDEVANGLIPSQEHNSKYYNSLYNVTKNITTPNMYHGECVNPINANILETKIAYFTGIIPDKEMSMSKGATAFGLYKLQPVESEAYEYQEKKESELLQQMIGDHALSAYAQKQFEIMEGNSLEHSELPPPKEVGASHI